MQAGFKGLERTWLDSILCISAATTWKTSEDNKGLYCFTLQGCVAYFFSFQMFFGNLNSCFVYYVTLLLPQSDCCHGLLSKLEQAFQHCQKPLKTQHKKTQLSTCFLFHVTLIFLLFHKLYVFFCSLPSFVSSSFCV